MNKSVIGGIVVLVIVLAGGGVLLARNSASDQSADNNSATDTSMNMSQDSMNSSDSSASASSEASSSNTVEIKGYAYSPANLTVKKGTKVTWTNQDSVQHDVMTDTDGKGPSSELLAKGESYSYTFDEVGTFSYHCTPHPYMKASVTVTE